MQINPIPQAIPTVPAMNPQAASQALPQVQAMAATPLTQRAVTPPTKGEKGNHSRSNEEEFQGGEDETHRVPVRDQRGHFINTSV